MNLQLLTKRYAEFVTVDEGNIKFWIIKKAKEGVTYCTFFLWLKQFLQLLHFAKEFMSLFSCCIPLYAVMHFQKFKP